jgi:hypothetical protein
VKHSSESLLKKNRKDIHINETGILFSTGLVNMLYLPCTAFWWQLLSPSAMVDVVSDTPVPKELIKSLSLTHPKLPNDVENGMACLNIYHQRKWAWCAFAGQAESGTCLFSLVGDRWSGREMSCRTERSASPSRSDHEKVKIHYLGESSGETTDQIEVGTLV